MNILKLYKYYRDKTLETFLRSLDIKTLKLLLQQMTYEKINYKRSTKNYSPEEHKKYSIPFLKRIDIIIVNIKDMIKEK